MIFSAISCLLLIAAALMAGVHAGAASLPIGAKHLGVANVPELVATVHFVPDKGLDNPNAGRAFLFVPKAAVFEENGHSYAWVVNSESKVSRRPQSSSAARR